MPLQLLQKHTFRLAPGSLVNSAIAVTNVWKTIQRYIIVHFQFEKTRVLFQSTREKTKQWTRFPNNDRPAWYELVQEIFTNRHRVISQNTRNIFDRPLFTDDSVQESSKQATYHSYTYRRIGVLVVQALVTRCRACAGVHTSDRRHWAQTNSCILTRKLQWLSGV